jgi:hypothetical protein
MAITNEPLELREMCGAEIDYTNSVLMLLSNHNTNTAMVRKFDVMCDRFKVTPKKKVDKQ